MKKLLIFYFVFSSLLSLSGQTIVHPHIWVGAEDRATILDNIATYPWANNLNTQLKTRIDPTKNSHKVNPISLLSTLPAIPGSRTTHRNMLNTAVEAGILYYLTNDEDYAQLAGDILSHYTKRISVISGNIVFYTGTDQYLIETREAYPRVGMIYDLIQPFLVKSSTTVFDNDSKTRMGFDMVLAQTTFKKLADNVFTRGNINNNHPVLEANGALFNILCISNDAERAQYFNRFMKGDIKQNGLEWMMKEFTEEEGIWPESVTYSVGPQEVVLHIMNIVDRYQPQLNVVANNLRILKGAFTFENFKYPSGVIMRYGDARRDRDDLSPNYERVLAIAKRKGLSDLSERSSKYLRDLYKANGGYKPVITTQTLEWNNPLSLLWGVDVDLTTVSEPISYNSTAQAEYAGISMQRNFYGNNEIENSLQGYTGGAHYVHSHCTGIAQEIYGLGLVMGTGGGDMNPDDRALDVNVNYYRIYAGNNSVIVNGVSKGSGVGSWKSDGLLYQNTTQNIASEPKPLQVPASPNYTFSTQLLDDKINSALQERTLAIIRTSATTGYYFDMVRSKSLSENKFHDYIYHNLGEELVINDFQNSALPLSSNSDRYVSVPVTHNGAIVRFPGWHYFENPRISNTFVNPVKARFKMTRSGTRYMHALIPGGEERDYTSTLGPPTLESEIGYDKIKTPILAIRQNGEAWDRPFVVIFEPSRSETSTISSTTNILSGSKVVGTKIVSQVQGKIVEDIIICQDDPINIYNNQALKISFIGRFGLVRLYKSYSGKDSLLELYIGEGSYLKYGDFELNGIDSSGIKSFDLSTTGTSKDFFDVAQPFPNPFNDKIELNDENIKKATLYNLKGQVVIVGTEIQTLNTSKVPAGQYLLKLEMEGKSRTIKMVKH